MSHSQKPNQGGKRRKNYYVNFKKKPKGNVLAPSSKGFILTCNSQEQSAVREAYNLLNEYADQLYGPSEEAQNNEVKIKTEQCSVEDELEAELNLLKNINSNKKRRFYQLHTGVKNVLFVQTEVSDPCKLVLTILDDLKKTQQLKTRYLLRLIPVLDTCKPFAENLKKTVADVLDFFLANHKIYQENKAVGYAVQFHARNNSKALKKEEVFSIVNGVVSEKCDSWKIELKNPDLILNVDVLTNACCFGILPDYSSYKRYNLYELVKSLDTEKEGKSLDTEKDIKVEKESESINKAELVNTDDLELKHEATELKSENADSTDASVKLENVTTNE